MHTVDLPRLPPELSTSRLILRGHSIDDFEDCAAMWGDRQVTRFIGGEPSNREQSWSRLLRYIGHWAMLGFGYWVIREKATGRFVGEAGFADFKRDIEASFGLAPEIGWVLAPVAFGQGFATEAATAALRWIDESLGSERTVCMIEPANAASLGVAAKCGYREYARAERQGREMILLERLRS